MTQPVTLPVDRLQGSLEQILALILPRIRSELAPMLQWEYRVTLVKIGAPGLPITVACVPVDVQNCPFGPLVVPMWKGPSGSPSLPVVGSLVVVAFHDGNPAKPAIVATDPVVPTVPPTTPTVNPVAPLTVAGALTQFAGALGTSVPAGAAACTALVAQLVPLL